MVSSSSTSVNACFHLGSANHSRRSRICVSQERVQLEKKPDYKTKLRIPKSVSISKDETIVPQPPLVAALEASAKQNVATFHFPGHNRGREAPSSLSRLIGSRPFLHDLPELPELGNLFSREGPIWEAQKQAAKLFGSLKTLFLVGGTTCGIQATIMATCSPGDILILPRNSHISAISAMVLSGAIPKYIIPNYNEDWDISYGVTPSQVEKVMMELELKGQQAAAVFVTSPTYHGICGELCKISDLCHSYGIPLIVDEAHGAHFGFHSELPPSALEQGADLAVQSTHKVLSSLTQSSMLHLSGNLVDRDRIHRCLQTLQSTSPSYLLLASLDAARAQLSESQDFVFNKAVELANELRKSVQEIPGISVLDFPSIIDPLRITIGFWKLGLSGYDADEILSEVHGIVCELVEAKSMTFAINLGTCEEHVKRLVLGIKQLSEDSLQNQNLRKRTAIITDRKFVPFAESNMSLSPRDAFFTKKRRASIDDCVGKVSGELICPYPPGIPVLVPGEIITHSSLNYLLDARISGADISGASDPLLSSILICDL
ncbi:uncharacterized protein [Rutidosis leptorrhynchoides]|uniref:uncharacterized protein n=1 Tax=Rutidosis leptorrhynchoides TaxID=125765 RepID=UPI003A9A370C